MTIEQDMRKDPNLHHTQGARVRFGIREGHPAVDVRDYSLWAQHTVAGPLQRELGGARAEAIYQGVVEDFWHVYAPEIAREFGYGEVWSAGRSEGWLYVDDGPDLTLDALNGARWADLIELDESNASSEDIEDERERVCKLVADRDKFVAFGKRIVAEVGYCGEQYIERLQEAVDELNERREANTRRGDQ